MSHNLAENNPVIKEVLLNYMPLDSLLHKTSDATTRIAQFIVFSHKSGLKTWRAKHPLNCSTSLSIFHVSNPLIFRLVNKRIKKDM